MLWLEFFLSLFILIFDLPSTSRVDYGSFSNWGFGQLLSVFVILLPFFTLMETYAGIAPWFINLMVYANSNSKRSRKRSQNTWRIQILQCANVFHLRLKKGLHSTLHLGNSLGGYPDRRRFTLTILRNRQSLLRFSSNIIESRRTYRWLNPPRA